MLPVLLGWLRSDQQVGAGSKRHMCLMSCQLTGCALAAPPLIDGKHIVADTNTENNPDLARREAASAASACWAADQRTAVDGAIEMR